MVLRLKNGFAAFAVSARKLAKRLGISRTPDLSVFWRFGLVSTWQSSSPIVTSDFR